MRLLSQLLRRLFVKTIDPPNFKELPIARPRYESRLTGEDFSRYDPEKQEAARKRKEASDAMRAKLTHHEASWHAPLMEVETRKRA